MQITKCILCKAKFEGYGNNPFPLADSGRCCDICNADVILERIKKIQEKNKK